MFFIAHQHAVHAEHDTVMAFLGHHSSFLSPHRYKIPRELLSGGIKYIGLGNFLQKFAFDHFTFYLGNGTR